MGEGNTISPSMTVFLSPPLSLLTLEHPVEMGALCWGWQLHVHLEGFTKTPLRLHVNGGAVTTAFAAWTPLLLWAQLELGHLRIILFCKRMWKAENTVSK